jgi:hypothetical protein
MKPEVSLTLFDKRGRSESVRVESSRFIIGKSADNDLVVDDESSSPRHALIETFDDVVQVSDCGSRGGTFLNGNLIARAEMVYDGDVISIGSDCRITVRIRDGKGEGPDAFARQVAADGSRRVSDSLQAQPLSPTAGLNPPVIALIAVAMILFGAVLAIALLKDDDPRPVAPKDAGETPVATVEPPARKPEKEESASQVSVEEQIKDALKRFMLLISTDRTPYFLHGEPFGDVKNRVSQFRSSPNLSRALRSIKAHSQEGAARKQSGTTEAAKHNLAIFTALAKTDGGQSGDCLSIARQMQPEIESLFICYGIDKADSSLYLVAGYQSGAGCRTLFANARRSNRNVWDMHKRGVIDQKTYDFIVKFLALGVISQNPNQFGVDAEPLAL